MLLYRVPSHYQQLNCQRCRSELFPQALVVLLLSSLRREYILDFPDECNSSNTWYGKRDPRGTSERPPLTQHRIHVDTAHNQSKDLPRNIEHRMAFY